MDTHVQDDGAARRSVFWLRRANVSWRDVGRIAQMADSMKTLKPKPDMTL